ncbi:MAG: sigma-70 family RNA polymerase sigma factor [Oscillospiraceae bacterium]|nr:sigma-70 family RNA polymerase sigma factor [Oscillospiraceae bacterium]
MDHAQIRTPEEAFRAFCDGEEHAFDEIMAQFQQPLTFFLFRYVHNAESAEDLAADTFVELLVHPKRYRGQSSLKTYLFSIARHKAIDFVRKEQRRSGVGLDQLKEQANTDPSLEDWFVQLQRRQALCEAMETLPEAQREVLRLLYFERLSYDEIASVTRRSKKQVDNILYRARIRLRDVLGKESLFVEELE